MIVPIETLDFVYGQCCSCDRLTLIAVKYWEHTLAAPYCGVCTKSKPPEPNSGDRDSSGRFVKREYRTTP